MNKLYQKIAELRLALSLYFNPTPKSLDVDIGYAEQQIDSNGEPVRRIRRETGSDLVSISEKGSDGRWTTRSQVCRKVKYS